MLNEDYFYKKNEADTIWWYRDPAVIGQPRFSFDKRKVYYLFRDYPRKLTRRQKEIFDQENPYWAEFFSDR